MKCRFLLWVILPVLLASCSPGRYPASLLTADSLSSVRPDSALCLLTRLAADTADAPLSHRMYYRLLCIKAADKAYLPHTSDSLIRPVLHYYIEGGDPRLLPEAYYYAGRVYRDLGDDLQALSWFQKALEAIRRNGDTDVHLKSKIYSQRATLYAYRKMYREALAMYQKVLKISTSTCDSVDMLFALRDIANMYRELHRPDSVLPYFKRAKQIADMLQRMDLSRMMQSQLAYAYLEVQAYDSARAALTEALLQVKRPNRSAVYSIAAHFYKTIGKTDSADYYNRKLLEIGTVYAKEKAYRELTGRLIRQVGNPPLDTLFNGWLQYADSLRTLDRKANELKTYADYDYLKSEQENARLKEKNARYMRHTLFIFSTLLLLALSFFAYWQYAKRRKEKLEFRLLQVRQLQDETERRDNEFLQKNKAHVRELEAKLAVLKEENNATWAKLNEERERYSALVRQVEAERALRQQADQLSAKSDIVQLLKKKAKSPTGQSTVTPTEWEALEKQIRLQYPSFLSKLKSLCYHFRRDELRLCMLIKMGFGPSDIGMLMEHPVQTITTMRRRLAKNILQSAEIRPQDWDNFIRSF